MYNCNVQTVTRGGAGQMTETESNQLRDDLIMHPGNIQDTGYMYETHGALNFDLGQDRSPIKSQLAKWDLSSLIIEIIYTQLFTEV